MTDDYLARVYLTRNGDLTEHGVRAYEHFAWNVTQDVIEDWMGKRPADTLYKIVDVSSEVPK